MNPLRIELPLGLSYPSVNAYFIPGPVPTLIDCGLNTAKTRGLLEQALEAAGYRLGDIARVLVTHPHVDHIGLAGVLAEHGAEIWLSSLSVSWISDLDRVREQLIQLLMTLLREHGFDGSTLQFAEGFYRGMAPLYSDIPAERTRVFDVGDTLEIAGRPWGVLYAPGHSNRQVCFFQAESGLLFSGDMLLPRAPVPVIETALDHPGTRDPGLPSLLLSYARFRELPVRQVFPGHGAPFGGHQQLIDEQVARIHRRKEECMQFIASGIFRLPDLLDAMYPSMPARERLGGLAMLVGYVDLLQTENRVRPIQRNGERRYEPAEHP